MSAFIRQIEMINQIDQLIRMQATGTPKEFADRLGISKTKLYRLINIMRDLNAPVEYDIHNQNFIYEEDVVYFRFGFYPKKLYKINQATGS